MRQQEADGKEDEEESDMDEKESDMWGLLVGKREERKRKLIEFVFGEAVGFTTL